MLCDWSSVLGLLCGLALRSDWSPACSAPLAFGQVFMEGRSALDNAAVLHLDGQYARAHAAAERALEIAEELDDDEARGECSTYIWPYLTEPRTLLRHPLMVSPVRSLLCTGASRRFASRWASTAEPCRDC